MTRDERDRPVQDARATMVALEEITISYDKAVGAHADALEAEAKAKAAYAKAVGLELAKPQPLKGATSGPENSRITGSNVETRDGQARALFPDLADKVDEAAVRVIAAKGRLDAAKIEWETQMRLVSSHRSILAYLSASGAE